MFSSESLNPHHLNPVNNLVNLDNIFLFLCRIYLFIYLFYLFVRIKIELASKFTKSYYKKWKSDSNSIRT